MSTLELLYHFVPALVLFSSVEVIQLAFYLKQTTSKETYRKMYSVWMMILAVMFTHNLGLIFEEFFHSEGAYKVLEMSSIGLFLGVMLLIRRGVISVGVLTGVTAELRRKVDEKTHELKMAKDQLEDYSRSLEKRVEERTKELNDKVEELIEARTALINMMDDVEATNRFLRDSVDRLKEVDSMKDQLLSNVSHELRTPITIVKSALELMLDDDITEDQKKLVSMSKNNLNRLDTLVGDLLYFSKGGREIPDEEFEKLSIKAVAQEAIAGIDHMAKVNNVDVSEDLSDDLPLIDASKNRLIQVFTNLLGNAIKFNKEKGSIRISGHYDKKDEALLIKVEDTGVGIPKEQLSRIFDRFYQVDGTTTRKYGGTGLGLAITKSIIEGHGGKIWAKSVVGQGTTFYFTLPLKRKKKYIVTLPFGDKIR